MQNLSSAKQNVKKIIFLAKKSLHGGDFVIKYKKACNHGYPNDKRDHDERTPDTGAVTAMLLSATDIGSNTVKTSIFEVSPTSVIEVTRKTIPAGLIGHIKNGELTDKGQVILVSALRELADFALSQGCKKDKIFPFATASLRAASNFDKVSKAVYDELGLTIDLVSGVREAELTFDSLIRLGSIQDRGLLIDLGGGSTEVIEFCGKEVISSLSIPMGALILYRKFVRNILPCESEMLEISKYSRDAFDSASLAKENYERLYINGGSGRAVAYLHSVLSGGGDDQPSLPYILSKGDLLDLHKRISECDDAVKQTLLRVLPTRIHTVAPALCAICSLMDKVGATTLEVTKAGIRESYIRYIIEKEGFFRHDGKDL